MSTYTMRDDGQLVSDGSHVRQTRLFSASLMLFGLLGAGLSVLFIDVQYGNIHYNPLRLCFLMAVGVFAFFVGLYLFANANKRLAKFFVFEKGMKMTAGAYTYSVEWHEIADFEPDRFGLSVSARFISSELDSTKNRLFVLPLLGNSAKCFANELNKIKNNFGATKR